MAKTYKRSRKYYKRKGVWSSRMTNVNDTTTIPANNTFFKAMELTKNPAQTSDSISQRFTVKNVKLQIQTECQSPQNINDIIYYIIYIPQGYVITETTPYNHPEWVMAMRFVGDPKSNTSGSAYIPLSISSRLARKLDTGDSIVLLMIGNNTSASETTIYTRGIVRMNTKAN